VNPWGFFLVVIGFLLIVIGVKGTQGHVLAAFKGVKQGQSGKGLSLAAAGSGAAAGGGAGL
jgi:hypothetical protein